MRKAKTKNSQIQLQLTNKENIMYAKKASNQLKIYNKKNQILKISILSKTAESHIYVLLKTKELDGLKLI